MADDHYTVCGIDLGYLISFYRIIASINFFILGLTGFCLGFFWGTLDYLGLFQQGYFINNFFILTISLVVSMGMIFFLFVSEASTYIWLFWEFVKKKILRRKNFEKSQIKYPYIFTIVMPLIIGELLVLIWVISLNFEFTRKPVFWVIWAFPFFCLLFLSFFSFRDSYYTFYGFWKSKKFPQFPLKLDQTTEEHDAIIFIHYVNDLKFPAYGDGIDLIIQTYQKFGRPYKVYPISSLESFINVVNNPKTKNLWIFGHGKFDAISFGFNNKLEYVTLTNAPKKNFVAQFHCNNCDEKCGKSLADHLATYKFVEKGTRNFIQNRQDAEKFMNYFEFYYWGRVFQT